MDLSLIIEINVGLLTASSIAVSLITYRPREPAAKEYFPYVFGFYWISTVLSTINLILIVIRSPIPSYVNGLTFASLYSFLIADIFLITLPHHFQLIFKREITIAHRLIIWILTAAVFGTIVLDLLDLIL